MAPYRTNATEPLVDMAHTLGFLLVIKVSHVATQLDQEVAGLVKRVHEASRRRNFFLAFSQSPVDFVNALIASQVRAPWHAADATFSSTI